MKYGIYCDLVMVLEEFEEIYAFSYASWEWFLVVESAEHKDDII